MERLVKANVKIVKAMEANRGHYKSQITFEVND